jgi:hypothetical protein
VSLSQHPRAGFAAALAGRLASIGLVFALAGCIYVPASVEGVPAGASWVALPLRGWLSEGSVRAEAITACFAPDCAPRAGVGVFRATGEEARAIDAILRKPERLARQLEQRAEAGRSGKPPAAKAVPTVAPMREGGMAGFALDLVRADGSRAAHAVVLGKPSGEALRFVMVIGEDEPAIQRLAREVASKLK